MKSAGGRWNLLHGVWELRHERVWPEAWKGEAREAAKAYRYRCWLVLTKHLHIETERHL